MQGKRRLILFVAAFTVVFGFLTPTVPLSAASTEKTLYSFCIDSNCTDGYGVAAGLIFDAAGNLYGTTLNGGAHRSGTVFQLAPGTGGTWTETVLYSFGANATDGSHPVASLIFDAAGNLYGTTADGGANNNTVCGGPGCGTVFQLTPSAGGKWTETLLYNFCSARNCADGANPSAPLDLRRGWELVRHDQCRRHWLWHRLPVDTREQRHVDGESAAQLHE